MNSIVVLLLLVLITFSLTATLNGPLSVSVNSLSYTTEGNVECLECDDLVSSCYIDCSDYYSFNCPASSIFRVAIGSASPDEVPMQCGLQFKDFIEQLKKNDKNYQKYQASLTQLSQVARVAAFTYCTSICNEKSILYYNQTLPFQRITLPLTINSVLFSKTKGYLILNNETAQGVNPTNYQVTNPQVFSKLSVDAINVKPADITQNLNPAQKQDVLQAIAPKTGSSNTQGIWGDLSTPPPGPAPPGVPIGPGAGQEPHGPPQPGPQRPPQPGQGPEPQQGAGPQQEQQKQGPQQGAGPQQEQQKQGPGPQQGAGPQQEQQKQGPGPQQGAGPQQEQQKQGAGPQQEGAGQKVPVPLPVPQQQTPNAHGNTITTPGVGRIR